MDNNYNLPFKSRINIVSMYKFAKLQRQGYEIIDFDKFGNNDRVLAKKFCALGVRTCCAGGITSKDKDIALGFHIWGDKRNLKSIVAEINNYTTNDELNGFLIGGKDLSFAPRSVKNFSKMQKVLKKHLYDFSYFKIFKKEYGEAYINYSKEDDTWNVLISYFNCSSRENIFRIRHTATKLKTFLNMFEEIHISDQDVLFIDGKEITKDMAPQIFKKSR